MGVKNSAPLKADERQKILDAQLRSMGVLDRIVEGDKFDTRHQDYIPIGIPEIEAELGEIAGFARGNLVELIGESGSGKTYVALKTSAQAQAKGLKVAFFNIENSFYEPRANAIGVNTRDKNLFQMIPNLGSGEKMCNMIIAMVESGLYGLIVVDSITALIPQAILEQDFEGPRKIGAHATLIGALASKLTYLCGETNTTVILINQYRIGAGVMPNTFVKKATGGEGLIFYDHYRFSFRKIGGAEGALVNANKEVIGGRSEITINKNRYGPSPKKLKFPIFFTEEDSDPVTDFIMRAKQKNVELIKESGRKDKKLRYVTEDGEVVESGNPKEFIDLLKATPAPSTKTRNDNSTTAFEYICRKIKFDDNLVKKLNEKLLVSDEFNLPNEVIDYESEDSSDEFES
jgi:recombination protein RecA